MTIHHHLEEDTLFAYAAGNLPEAFNLIIAAHVSLCDECRAVVESYDMLGGAILEEAVLEEVSADSLAKTLARLERPTEPPKITYKRGVFPSPLQDYIGGDLDAVKWRSVGSGLKQAVLETSDAATARLLMIPAGAAMPVHSHKGNELTLVLKGAYSDEDGRFARGDIEVADGSVSHTPVAEEGEECICLIVTDAPLKFKGWLPWMAQKIVRI